MKAARHHYYAFFPRILGKLSCKRSALLLSEILSLFANTLTANDKYSCHNMHNFLQQIQTLLSQKRKISSGFFFCISEMCMKFTTFWKKRWVFQPNYFPNYCYRKRLLLKRLKALASKHHSVINLLTRSKHRWKQQGTTIILFSHEFQVNWVG